MLTKTIQDVALNDIKSMLKRFINVDRLHKIREIKALSHQVKEHIITERDRQIEVRRQQSLHHEHESFYLASIEVRPNQNEEIKEEISLLEESKEEQKEEVKIYN